MKAIVVICYLQCIYCICTCINRGVNLLHPFSLQCQLLLRLIPLHQTPLRTHACISPTHPKCRHTHLRCHSVPLCCTANNNLQVCSNIASECTFYLSETLTCFVWLLCSTCFSFQQLLCISSHSLSFRRIYMRQMPVHVVIFNWVCHL